MADGQRLLSLGDVHLRKPDDIYQTCLLSRFAAQEPKPVCPPKISDGGKTLTAVRAERWRHTLDSIGCFACEVPNC